MFTGIIEELGSVEAIEDQGDAVRLSVRGPLVVSDAGEGDSIAVNGCCLTVVEHDGERFTADVMLVGTNTVEVDDPQLTVRDEHDQAIAHQPLRVVMGERDLDPSRRVFDDQAESLHLRTRDPEAALKELFARDRQHVFLEGGPTLAAAFLRAGLVDEIVTYVAPMLLGAGGNAVGDLGITTISEALHLQVQDVTVLDDNVRLTMRPAVEGKD